MTLESFILPAGIPAAQAGFSKTILRVSKNVFASDALKAVGEIVESIHSPTR